MNKKVLILGVLGICGMALAFYTTKKTKKVKGEPAEPKENTGEESPEEIRRKVMREMGRKGGQSKKKKAALAEPVAPTA